MCVAVSHARRVLMVGISVEILIINFSGLRMFQKTTLKNMP